MGKATRITASVLLVLTLIGNALVIEWGNLIDVTANYRYPGYYPRYTLHLEPAMAVDSKDNVRMVWTAMRYVDAWGVWTYRLCYVRMNKYGTSIGTITEIYDWLERPDHPKSIAVDPNDNVHIVYLDEGYIWYYKLSNDGAVLVQQKMVVGTWLMPYPGTVPHDPYVVGYRYGTFQIASDSLGKLHLVWEDTKDGYREIYYKQLDLNGNNVTKDIRLNQTAVDKYHPSLAIDGNNSIHIVWSEPLSIGGGVFYTKLSNDGKKIVEHKLVSQVLNSSAEAVDNSRVSVDPAGNVHIAYRYIPSGWPGSASSTRWALYYTKLNNAGTVLIPPPVHSRLLVSANGCK